MTLIAVLVLANAAVAAGSVAVHDGESADKPAEIGVSVSQPDEQETGLDIPHPSATVDLQSIVAQQQADDEHADNETTRHEHPDEARGAGDDGAYADWLSNELSGALGQSTIELSEGQYDQARSIIGDDYDERLEQYVEVSEDVDTGNGGAESDAEDETDPAAEFRESQENQREFVDSVEQYQETYEEYQEAREAGDDERALELARELEQFADRTEESGSSLVNSYGNISTHSDQDLEEETETVVEIDEEISDQQQEIREREFEETEIVADVESPDASFLSPLIIGGTVMTDGGQAVNSGQVAILADGRATTAAVTDGTFQLEYRPALLPENASETTVTYVPDNETVYLQSSTEVPIDPGTIQPTVEVTNTTGTASYGDRVVVEGRIVADDVAVDQVPVEVAFEGQQLGETNRTLDDGMFTVETSVPDDVPAGESELVIAYPLTDRSLESASTRQSLTIDETDTDLSVEAAVNDSGSVDVTGTLQTTDGDPLSNQSVQLSIGEGDVETVETNEEGTFETRAEIPQDIDGGTADLVASYEDPETNLADDRTAVELSIGDESLFQPGSPLYWTLAGLVLIAAGISLLSSRLRLPKPGLSAGILSGSGGGTKTNVSIEDDREEDDVDPVQNDATEDGPELPMPDEVAQKMLERGDVDAATAIAYTLVRRRLETDVEDGESKTHWEFYDEWQAKQDNEASDSLECLTELYERAAFAPDSLSEREAAKAVYVATTIAADKYDVEPG